jgi:hypothetical protein
VASAQGRIGPLEALLELVVQGVPTEDALVVMKPGFSIAEGIQAYKRACSKLHSYHD